MTIPALAASFDLDGPAKHMCLRTLPMVKRGDDLHRTDHAISDAKFMDT